MLALVGETVKMLHGLGGVLAFLEFNESVSAARSRCSIPHHPHAIHRANRAEEVVQTLVAHLCWQVEDKEVIFTIVAVVATNVIIGVDVLVVVMVAMILAMILIAMGKGFFLIAVVAVILMIVIPPILIALLVVERCGDFLLLLIFCAAVFEDAIPAAGNFFFRSAVGLIIVRVCVCGIRRGEGRSRRRGRRNPVS